MTVSAVVPDVLSVIAFGLEQRLQLAFPPARFQFDYMPPRIAPTSWDQVVRRPPFIGLGWNELEGRNTPRRIWAGTSSWTVYLIVDNIAGQKNRLMGDAQGPGLFQMVQAGVIALNGLGIVAADGGLAGTCTVTRTAQAFAEGWTKQSIAMAAIDLTVTTAIDVASDLTGVEASPDLLSEIAASWIFSDPTVPGNQPAAFEDVTFFPPSSTGTA